MATKENVTIGTPKTSSRQSHAEDTLEEDSIDNIKNWDIKSLTNFLTKNLSLDDGELDILAEEKVIGEDFFRLTKEELRNFGIKGGPAGKIAAFAESLRPKICSFTLRYEEMVKTFKVTYRSLSNLSLKRFQQIAQEAFSLPDAKIIIKYNDNVLISDETVQFAFKSKEIITLNITLDKKEFYSYKNLKEVLQLYEIDGDEVHDIPQFSPDINNSEINETNFNNCMEQIKSILIAIGDVQCDQNEAQRSFFITAILVAAVNSVSNTFLNTKLIGSFNYAIEKIYSRSATEEIVYITEAKQNNIKEGIAQNIMQIRSEIETCSNKHKLDELSQGYSKYVYGIVTNATEWHFLKYTPDQIYCSHAPKIIPLILAQDNDYENLKESVKIIFEIIIWMLTDQNRTQSNKKQCSVDARTVIL